MCNALGLGFGEGRDRPFALVLERGLGRRIVGAQPYGFPYGGYLSLSLSPARCTQRCAYCNCYVLSILGR